MKTYKFLRVLIIIIALSIGTMSAQATEYSFQVQNTTDLTIIRLLVSEDSQIWGDFNIGNGIAAGESETLTWDKSTNNENCFQYVKVIFENGRESVAVTFDFCQNNLALVF